MTLMAVITSFCRYLQLSLVLLLFLSVCASELAIKVQDENGTVQSQTTAEQIHHGV